MYGDAEGQIVLIQAAGYLQSRRQVKDFATWSQCALYSAILLSGHGPIPVSILGHRGKT